MKIAITLIACLLIFSSFQTDTTKTRSVDTIDRTQSAEAGEPTNEIPEPDGPDFGADQGSEGTRGKRFITNYEFTLSAAVLVFSIIILALEVYLIKTKQIDSNSIIKFIIVTLIITATLFLITAGYSATDISPGIGLLGTIAGYLLGKSDLKTESKS